MDRASNAPSSSTADTLSHDSSAPHPVIVTPPSGSKSPYRALESPNTFRLLKLHSSEGDKVNCTLEHHTLGSTDYPYRALSYTWDQDEPRHSVFLSDGSIIKVRKNLWNALKFLRDKKSDCYLWIDAICINQQSNQERNHQVRLMANIYGDANIVLVWLPSEGQSGDVARAFDFMQSTVKYWEGRAVNSGFDFVQHSSAIENMCRLRYWTRQWIIQELIVARTVVIQSGNSQYSMTVLENFCYELRRRDTTMRSTILASPAARLALQRSDATIERQPRLLHELIERYERSQCKEPSDHVYALYSLIGEHRKHLNINYDIHPVQRLAEVIRFVCEHENMQPSGILPFTELLMKLLRINRSDIGHGIGYVRDLRLKATAAILGTVELLLESADSVELRKMVEPLIPIPVYMLETSQDVWPLAISVDLTNPPGQVGRSDMIYFKIANSDLWGLAACKLQAGDEIWHLKHTLLGFGLRRVGRDRARLLGNTYIFHEAHSDCNPGSWLLEMEPSLESGTRVRPNETHISMDLSTLLSVSSLANPKKLVAMNTKRTVTATKRRRRDTINFHVSSLLFHSLLRLPKKKSRDGR